MKVDLVSPKPNALGQYKVRLSDGSVGFAKKLDNSATQSGWLQTMPDGSMVITSKPATPSQNNSVQAIQSTQVRDSVTSKGKRASDVDYLRGDVFNKEPSEEKKGKLKILGRLGSKLLIGGDRTEPLEIYDLPEGYTVIFAQVSAIANSQDGWQASVYLQDDSVDKNDQIVFINFDETVVVRENPRIKQIPATPQYPPDTRNLGRMFPRGGCHWYGNLMSGEQNTIFPELSIGPFGISRFLAYFYTADGTTTVFRPIFPPGSGIHVGVPGRSDWNLDFNNVYRELGFEYDDLYLDNMTQVEVDTVDNVTVNTRLEKSYPASKGSPTKLVATTSFSGLGFNTDYFGALIDYDHAVAWCDADAKDYVTCWREITVEPTADTPRESVSVVKVGLNGVETEVRIEGGDEAREEIWSSLRPRAEGGTSASVSGGEFQAFYLYGKSTDLTDSFPSMVAARPSTEPFEFDRVFLSLEDPTKFVNKANFATESIESEAFDCDEFLAIDYFVE